VFTFQLNIDRRKSPGLLNSLLLSGDDYHRICPTKHLFKSTQITLPEEDCRCAMNDDTTNNVYCEKAILKEVELVKRRSVALSTMVIRITLSQNRVIQVKNLRILPNEYE
jgi:hypothetical protein